MNLKNNLFTYATSELSQDAFLCWLLSFAQSDSKNIPALRACAETFLRVAIPALGNADICVNDIAKQDHFVDALITVNNQYKLIIEDKTNTSEHSDQLNIYKRTVSERFPEFEVCGVYYKTGFQSDYREVHRAGYTMIDRRKMIEIMKPHADKIKNHIWQDYYEFITEFEREAQRYQSLPINLWGWEQIKAFYDFLQHSGFLDGLGVSGDFGYVSNPNGGFEGMWFGHWDQPRILEVRCELYLQLQFTEGQLYIYLKLSANRSDLEEKHVTGKMLRNHLTYGVEGDYLFGRYGFSRPTRFGSGRTMTLGVYQELPLSAEEAIMIIPQATDAYLHILSDIQNAGV